MMRFNTMKLQLTNDEIKAVKDSVKHWKKDIRDRLEKGDLILTDYFPYIWSSDNSAVKMYDENCALCLLLKNNNVYGFKFCTDCVYYKKYGVFCTGLNNTGAWENFRQNPTLRTCNKMIKALENILE